MDFYEEMAALALELLNEFGRPATLVRQAPQLVTFDKQAGREIATAKDPVSQPVKTVVQELLVTDEEGRKVTRSVATLLVEPKTGDTLKQGRTTFTVGRVRTVAPVGSPIIHYAEVE